jgi:hypothetical protein
MCHHHTLFSSVQMVTSWIFCLGFLGIVIFQMNASLVVGLIGFPNF